MGEYVDIGGHPTWFEDRGSGDEIVLLMHGGMSNSDTLLDSLGPALLDRYRVVAFDRRGHGRTKDTDVPFHYDTMTDETIGIIEHVGEPVHLVGWSDGGIIGLLLARRRPELLRRMVVIGANYHFEGIHELDLPPDSPAIAMIVADYGERSPDGADHFAAIMEKTFTMFATEPTMTVADLAEIAVPTLVMVGDDDLPRLAHSCQLYEALAGGQLAVVPGASHVVPLEKPDLVARLVGDFLAETSPPETMMPVRRTTPTG